ncbi:MAG TPA: sulfite exporter TauE/SafE family protein [Lactobacillaceae bacterium]|jgi:hypothetical protein
MLSLLVPVILMLTTGLFAGVLGALLGLGGGIIVTPILVLGFGVPIHVAFGVSVLAVIASSLGTSLTYLRQPQDLVNMKLGFFMEIPVTIGGIIGALLVSYFSTSWLNTLFGCLMLYQAIMTAYKLAHQGTTPLAQYDPLAEKLAFNQVDYQVEKVTLSTGFMVIVGMASGLLGIGSGMLGKGVAFDNLMKLPVKTSSATSNFMMGLPSSAIAITYWLNGGLDLNRAVPVVLGVLLGSVIGARIMPLLPTLFLRWLFVPVIGFAGVQLVLKAFSVRLY